MYRSGMDAEGIEPSQPGGDAIPPPGPTLFAILIDHVVSVVKEAAC